MKNEQPISITKLIIYTIMPLQRPITAFFLLFVGIVAGLTLRSHFNAFSFTNSLRPNPPSLITSSIWNEAADFSREDEDLIKRVMKMGSPPNRGRTAAGKVAFLFLTKSSLPLAPFWDKFFEKHEGRFSVYVHIQPQFNWSIPQDSVFYGSIIPSQVVEWGKFNMIEAERRLLANALLEPTNQRFILLSESCVPLFNFQTIYSYLMGSAQNFVEAYREPGLNGLGRYRKSFQPLVFPQHWLKGSQWFSIKRDLATAIVTDDKYFSRFKKICGATTCHADEHYLPTFVNLRFANTNSNRSLTWADWSGGGMHPRTYFRLHVTVDFLKGMRNNRSCDIEVERDEKEFCYLFARKFYPNALNRFIKFGVKVMHF